ncbi:MAG: bacteriohemerythrin [Sulfuricella sp.]|nr:bacteriohemerythrin [Sulfuricella sp.]
MENIVAWQDAYSLEMPEIDAQHKVLLDLINQVWNAVVGRVSIEKQIELIEKLEHYTLSHFAAEETFLRTIQYPEFDEHKKAHEIFVQRIAAEKANLLANGHLTLDMLHFLKDWLINHILGTDKKYAQFSQGKTSSSSFVGRFFSALLGKR